MSPMGLEGAARGGGAESGDRRSDPSIWWFLILTCLLSWPIWVLSGVLPRAGAGAYDVRWLLAQVGVFGPSLAALIVSGVNRSGLRRNNSRILGVLLLPLLVPGLLVAAASPGTIAELPPAPSAASLAIATLVILFFLPLGRDLRGPGTGKQIAKPAAGRVFLSIALLPALFLVAWLVAHPQGEARAITAVRGGALEVAWVVLVIFCHNLLLGGPLGEEIGWRGFLLPRLLERMSPLRASLAVGVVWGLWHLPIDLYAGFGVEGAGAVLMRVIYALPLSVLFTWFYLSSTGSLLVVLLLHTSLNVMGDLGLSGFESTGLVFFIFMSGAAVIVAASSPIFRGESGGP